MTDLERMKSILGEIEWGYIGIDNLHGDEDHGLRIIKEALEKQIPKKPIKTNYIIPVSKTAVRHVDRYKCNKCNSDIMQNFIRCPYCETMIDWEET